LAFQLNKTRRSNPMCVCRCVCVCVCVFVLNRKLTFSCYRFVQHSAYSVQVFQGRLCFSRLPGRLRLTHEGLARLSRPDLFASKRPIIRQQPACDPAI